MSIRVEAYTQDGIVTGRLTHAGHLRDALEGATELRIEQPSFVSLDGRRPAAVPDLRLVVDDVVLAVPDEPMSVPVHAAWHAISLDAGPYRIVGELATLPGFDPGRALTRPTGEFVLLRDVRVALLDRPQAGEVTHPQGLVNRYAVDAVEADLMLGFFFPGARMALTPGVTVTAAEATAVDAGAGSGGGAGADGGRPRARIGASATPAPA